MLGEKRQSIIVFIMMLAFELIAYWNGEADGEETIKTEEKRFDVEPPIKIIEASEGDDIIVEHIDEDIMTNDLFVGNSSVEYEIKYSWDEGYEIGKITLDIVEVKDLKEGKLYVMDTEDEIPVEGFPIYIYVKEDEIYRLWRTSEEMEEIESEEELLEKSTLVCQYENLPDQLDEYEEGVHHYITVENDEVESRYFHYNDCANVTGYWESFTWKKGWD